MAFPWKNLEKEKGVNRHSFSGHSFGQLAHQCKVVLVRQIEANLFLQSPAAQIHSVITMFLIWRERDEGAALFPLHSALSSAP